MFFGILLCLFLITVGCFVFLTKEVGNIDYSEAKIQYQNLPINNWEKFSSADGKFSILFPGIPETTNVIAEYSTVSGVSHIFYVNYNIQNTFAVAYDDSPLFAKSSIKKDPQEFLKLTQSLWIKEPGKIVFEQQSKFEGYPAREFEFAAGGKANYSIRVKMILVNQRVYLIYVIFLTANPHPADRATFFNSFSLN